jgi:hypothetical protein
MGAPGLDFETGETTNLSIRPTKYTVDLRLWGYVGYFALIGGWRTLEYTQS